MYCLNICTKGQDIDTFSSILGTRKLIDFFIHDFHEFAGLNASLFCSLMNITQLFNLEVS